MKLKIVILLFLMLIPVIGYCQPKIYAEVENGKVRNVFEWKEASIPFLGSKVIIVDITTISPKPQISYLYDGINFSAPSIPLPQLIVSKKELWERFTDTEKNSIISSVDIKVKRFLTEIPILDSVDLKDTKVINIIRYLETAGLITLGRADQILK